MKTLNVSTRFLCVSGLLLWGTARAQAGSWGVERYVWNGTSQEAVVRISTSNYYGPSITNEAKTLTKVMRDNQLISFQNGSDVYPHAAVAGWGTNWYDPWTDSTTSRGASSFTGTVDTTIYAVFKWHRNQIADPNHPYQTQDDPTDNPPKYLFTREKGLIVGSKSTLADSVHGEIKSKGGMNVTLEDSQLLRYEDSGGGGYAHNAEIDIVRRLNVTGDEVVAPPLLFKGTATVVPDYSGQHSGGGASAHFVYDAAPAVMNVTIWTQGDAFNERHGPSHNAPRRDENTPTVAAGSKGTEADPYAMHLFGVGVQLSPPLAGQKLLPVKILIEGPKHVQNSWKWAYREAEHSPNAYTNEFGGISLGYLISNDIANANFEISVPGQPSTTGPAHYRQAWDEIIDTSSSSSQETHWEYNKDFDYDTDIDVTFKPRFKNSYFEIGDDPQWVRRSNPISGHTMNFMLGKIQVSGVINQGYSYPQTWIFTSNPLDVLYSQYSTYNGPPVKLVDQAELDQICEPKTATDLPHGNVYDLAYKTKLRIKEPPSTPLEEHVMHIGDMTIYDASIEQVWMKAQDNDVYQPDPTAQ